LDSSNDTIVLPSLIKHQHHTSTTSKTNCQSRHCLAFAYTLRVNVISSPLSTLKEWLLFSEHWPPMAQNYFHWRKRVDSKLGKNTCPCINVDPHTKYTQSWSCLNSSETTFLQVDEMTRVCIPMLATKNFKCNPSWLCMGDKSLAHVEVQIPHALYVKNYTKNTFYATICDFKFVKSSFFSTSQPHLLFSWTQCNPCGLEMSQKVSPSHHI